MNESTVGGKFDQIKGSIKQGIGEAVGNDSLANQGVADQVKGQANETWGNVKDAVAGTTATTHPVPPPPPSAPDPSWRDSITGAANEVKSTIGGGLDHLKSE